MMAAVKDGENVSLESLHLYGFIFFVWAIIQMMKRENDYNKDFYISVTMEMSNKFEG